MHASIAACILNLWLHGTVHTSYNIITLTILHLIVCADLSDPANGRVNVSGDGTNEGDVATFYCNKGYNMIGSDTVTCQPKGGWSGPPPICEG